MNNQMFIAEYTPSNIRQNSLKYMDFGGDRTHANIDAFMHDFNETHREDFNPILFERSDDETIEQLEKVILSCQRDRYFTLKVLSFRVIKNYEEIQSLLWNHEESRRKPNDTKFENPYDFINLKDSDIMLLEVTYFIRINNAILDIKDKEDTMVVYIALPRFVDKYYYRISGNYYSSMLQIVDGSVYNNSASKSKKQSVTLKTTFMAVRLYRLQTELKAIDDETVKCIYYVSHIFNKYLDVMKYLFARFGVYGTFSFLNIHNIYISDKPNEDTENYYTFQKYNLYVIVPKFLFDNEPIIQSLCVTLLNNMMKDASLNDIFNPRYWLCALGGEFKSYSIDKGIPILDSLESVYDLTTKDNLRLPDTEKDDIYYVLRWMIREFSNLRMRDNLDTSFKRIRMAPEYLASVYAMKVLRGIYRISDEGRSITVDKIKRAIYTNPMYILTVTNSTKLISYVDMVNDNDAATAIEYTYKGISGLGDKDSGNGGSIPVAYRFTHPAQIGRIDLDSSSPSDPGLSGILCPHVDIYENGFFQDYQEPITWENEFKKLLDEYNNLRGMKQAIEFQKECGFEFDNVKDEIVQECMEHYSKLIPGIIELAEQEKQNYMPEDSNSNDVEITNPFRNLLLSSDFFA